MGVCNLAKREGRVGECFVGMVGVGGGSDLSSSQWYIATHTNTHKMEHKGKQTAGILNLRTNYSTLTQDM